MLILGVLNLVSLGMVALVLLGSGDWEYRLMMGYLSSIILSIAVLVQSFRVLRAGKAKSFLPVFLINLPWLGALSLGFSPLTVLVEMLIHAIIGAMNPDRSVFLVTSIVINLILWFSVCWLGSKLFSGTKQSQD